jgi:hypothetical protein
LACGLHFLVGSGVAAGAVLLAFPA